MQPSSANLTRPQRAPSFHVIERQPPRPAAVLLAVLTAACVLFLVSFGLGRSRAARFKEGSASAARTPAGNSSSASPDADDKDDDPSQVDTIVLGDAADAPVPARRGQRVSNVHATIIVHLPRFGRDVGLIPDSPAGHLLYGWLAAFNNSSYSALQAALPNVSPAFSASAQMDLRQQTGGFNLISAREIQPGVLVFRLLDQTGKAGEVLGTLQVRPNSSPAAIATFSLRAVPPAAPRAAEDTASPSVVPR